MNKYLAFGLIFESEIEWVALSPIETERDADVSIVLSPVSEQGLENPNYRRVLAQANEQAAWFHVPNVARFLVSGGCQVRVDVLNPNDLDTVCLYLMGSCMGAIIHQRGMLALHASAVDIDGDAALFLGVSGAGKSTTAALLHQRGYQVISDDTVAIKAGGEIAGGLPQIKLWEKALDSLEIPKAGLSRIRNQVNKYRFPVSNQDSKNYSVSVIYILARDYDDNQTGPRVAPITGLEKFRHLQRHTYRANIMEGTGMQTTHLRICSNLAGSVPMSMLSRSTHHFCGDELADLILQDMEQVRSLAVAR